jgi:hypothetical protein
MPKLKGEGWLADDGPRAHFIQCLECGAVVDMRDLGQVLAHEQQHAGTRNREHKKPEILVEKVRMRHAPGPSAFMNFTDEAWPPSYETPR